MNILLIEDDNFFQKFYATKLREQAFTVDVASNGEEGLKKVKEARYDLLLLDLVMPKIDGFEVLRILSQDDTVKNIPVLVFSTLGQEQDIQKAKELGARDYMNKTFFNFEELLGKIKKLTNN
jgi:DNA-binding response OmpR family regulator